MVPSVLLQYPVIFINVESMRNSKIATKRHIRHTNKNRNKQALFVCLMCLFVAKL